MIEGAAAVAAWIGAALIVLSDGRRGLALGVALAAAGLAVIAWFASGVLPALLIAAGGIVAAARRLTGGTGTWAIMPPGSTPRLILCVAAALLALWVALGITTGHSAAMRFAVLVVIGLAGARVLSTTDAQVQLTAVAALALAVGTAAGLADGAGEPWPYIAAALVAAGAGWLRESAPSAA